MEQPAPPRAGQFHSRSGAHRVQQDGAAGAPFEALQPLSSSASCASCPPVASKGGLVFALRRRFASWFLCDPTRVAQVFNNLLNNDQVHRCGRVPTSPAMAQLIVRGKDTGCGIPADMLPHVFERFRQVDNFPTRRRAGHRARARALGKLVGLMGGEVRVRSEEARAASSSSRCPSTACRRRPSRRLRAGGGADCGPAPAHELPSWAAGTGREVAPGRGCKPGSCRISSCTSDSTPSATVCSDRSRAMLMMARISLISASLWCSSETKERSIFSTSKRKLRRWDDRLA